MTLSYWTLLGLALVIPFALSCVDLVPITRSRKGLACEIDENTSVEHDFVVLVPIYGSIRYLENVDYLSRYGNRVWLCTTTGESPEFDADLDAVAAANDFVVFRGEVPRQAGAGAKAVGGTVRDRLVRDASAQVTAKYVVCLDADTETSKPLELLVGAIVDGGWDLVSVRLIPSNRETLLARLQGHEYRMAMRLRRIMPWLISGACHAGKSAVHRDVMARHSLFFQGNDAELGLLAHAMGYHVGHILFDVPTTVPHQWHPWFRQRLAWSGGQFRLFIVNIWLLPKHVSAFAYGALFVFLLLPLRWWALFQPKWFMVLLAVYVLYIVAMLVVNWSERDLALLVVPLYGLFITLVIEPFGFLWYLRMAWADRNAGLIRPHRLVDLPPAPTLAASGNP